MRCIFSPSEPQAVLLVFQLAGGVSVHGTPGAGGVRVQLKSEVLGCFKQISSTADEIVRTVQFWLSQFTDIPVASRSGMALPDGAGWAAHKVVESQLALGDGEAMADEGVLEPPQLANSVARVSKMKVPRVDGMQMSVVKVGSNPVRGSGEGRARPPRSHCLPFAKSSRGPAHLGRSLGRSLVIIQPRARPPNWGQSKKDHHEFECPASH